MVGNVRWEQGDVPFGNTLDILMEVPFTREKWPCRYMNEILDVIVFEIQKN